MVIDCEDTASWISISRLCPYMVAVSLEVKKKGVVLGGFYDFSSESEC